MFDEGETVSKDPEYMFCPAPHRQQILHLFTKHFCQHSIFPERHGTYTAAEIRRNAVKEMYDFCKVRGLCEVWGYMWACWYTPKMWRLWARSTSPYLSRLRTTMGVENFWRQLKHNYLHNYTRPRLDQLVWVLIHKVTPAYFARMNGLQDGYRMGRSKPLTAYQRRFKTAWIKMKNKEPSGTKYTTDVRTWTCNCGSQKYHCHHICKHLVRAVEHPALSFWRNVIRRRVVPIYQHPVLVPLGEAADDYIEPDGAITDGDDHLWSGNPSTLEGDGGWEEFAGAKRSREASPPAAGTNKRPARQHEIDEAISTQDDPLTDTVAAEVIDLTASSPPASPIQLDEDLHQGETGFSDSSAFDYGSDDELKVSICFMSAYYLSLIFCIRCHFSSTSSVKTLKKWP